MYNEDQSNLIETFSYSLVERVHPKIFEDNIIKNEMKLKSRQIKNDYVNIPLTHIQILHFKLLYYIFYINRVFPEKILNLNLSEDLSELFDNEDRIISLYKEIKKIVLN